MRLYKSIIELLKIPSLFIAFFLYVFFVVIYPVYKLTKTELKSKYIVKTANKEKRKLEQENEVIETKIFKLYEQIDSLNNRHFNNIVQLDTMQGKGIQRQLDSLFNSTGR